MNLIQYYSNMNLANYKEISGSDSKVSVYNVGDLGSTPGSGRIPGEGNGNPLQYSCLENPMDGGAWCPWGRKESKTTERFHFLSFSFLPTVERAYILQSAKPSIQSWL